MSTIKPTAKRMVYIPRTPGGTDCVWLKSKSEQQAWSRLLEDAAHMPYSGVAEFKQRVYTVNAWEV